MKYKAQASKIFQNRQLATYATFVRENIFVENLSAHLGVMQKIQICPVEKTIFFNKISLDLSHQPKMFRVFYFLFLGKENGLDRDELIRKVYNPLGLEMSERQKRCHRHNIIKLMSRK